MTDSAAIPIPLRTCVTCRHLVHLGQSQAVPGLTETISERWRCAKFGAEAEEFPYFPTEERGRVTIERSEKAECPGWEFWREDSSMLGPGRDDHPASGDEADG